MDLTANQIDSCCHLRGGCCCVSGCKVHAQSAVCSGTEYIGFCESLGSAGCIDKHITALLHLVVLFNIGITPAATEYVSYLVAVLDDGLEVYE